MDVLSNMILKAKNFDCKINNIETTEMQPYNDSFKRTLLTLCLLIASPTHAAGVLDCTSAGGFVQVRGTDSSAGTAVTHIQLGERVVTDFTVPGIYYNFKTFSFLALDKNYDKRVLQVETVVGESKEGHTASGLAWIGEQRDLVPIICYIGY